jgi:hypothetical protein
MTAATARYEQRTVGMRPTVTVSAWSLAVSGTTEGIELEYNPSMLGASRSAPR